MPNADRLETYASQYFTGTQASIWIGDIWVDEVFGIQFSSSQSVLPVFGYASSFFDAVARGKVLVQGVFEINFIDEGYLYSILNARTAFANNLPENQDVLTQRRENGGLPNPTRAGGIIQQLQTLKDVSEGSKPDSKSRRQTMGSIMNQIAQLDVVSLEQMASQLNRRTPSIASRNIIYDMVPFNLRGYFGNPELGGTEAGTFKEITDCFLIGNEMVVGGSDEIVKERYSFLARYHI